LLVAGDVFITGESIFKLVEPVKPVAGAYPQVMATILKHTTDVVIAEGIYIGRIVFKYGDLVAIIPVKPVAGAKPDKTPIVLVNGFNGAV
jgi:hypothetical protein